MRRLGLRRAHPAPRALSRYLDGELSPRDRYALERHVAQCVACRRLLRSLSRTIHALGSLHEQVPSRRAEVIIAALSAPSADAAWRPRLRFALRYCLQRSQLRFTVPMGLVVGAILTLANQGAMLVEGDIDAGMCAICALDFLVPFVAINVVLLATARAVWPQR